MKAHIEQYEADGRHREMDLELDPNTLDELVDSLRGAWSATLRIPGSAQELALSFSSGSAAVALIAGEDEFYDLLASEPREGVIAYRGRRDGLRNRVSPPGLVASP